MKEKYLKQNVKNILEFTRELKKENKITEKQLLWVYYNNYLKSQV